jgi:hypothetical protein
MAQIKYTEQTRQAQIYDFLVYVCGEDISNYVKSIEVTRSDRGGIGSATLNLSNAMDQWVITQSNVKGYWRQTKDKYSELPKLKIFQKKRKLSSQQGLPAPKSATANQGSLNTNVTTDPELLRLEQEAATLTNLTGESSNVNVQNDFLQRYAFGPGALIFSKLDTVRIYIRDPYSDPDTTDKWMPFFTGLVDAKPFTTNYVTGESSVTLNCYDVRNALQGMRIGVNPYKNVYLRAETTVSDAENGIVTSEDNVLTIGAGAGYFKDYIGKTVNNSPDSFSNIFANKTFVDAISMVLTGTTGWVNGTAATEVKEGEGVGTFTRGEVYRYKNPNSTEDNGAKEGEGRVSDLTDWDNLLLFGVNKRFWTLRECQAEGEDSFFTGNRHPFVGKVHFLLPSNTLNVASLITQNFEGINDLMGSPDWTDRYTILVQLCNQVDYQFTVTPTGDIAFEFPMYDFFPTSFSGHDGIYRVNKHVKSDSISDEGGEVLAGLQVSSVSSQQGQAQVDAAGNATPQNANVPDMRGLIYSNVLLSKYGAKIQNVSFTGVKSAKALMSLGRIEFQKRLAEANKLSFEMVFRPYLLPNRPMLFEEPNRARIGKTTSVTYAMTVFQEPTMSLALGCVRTSLQRGNTTLFQHITGGQGMAISYNSLIEDSGIGGVISPNNPDTTPSGGKQ